MSMLSMLLQNILQNNRQNSLMQAEEQKKAQENQMLAQLLSRPSGQQLQNSTDVAYNLPGPAMPQYDSEDTFSNRSQALLSNPDIPIESKIRGLQALDYQRQITAPPKPEDSSIMEWWDKSGQPHKTRVGNSQYNAFAQKVESMGGRLGKPEGANYVPSELEKLIDRLPNETSPAKKAALQKRINKLTTMSDSEGSTKNTVKVGDQVYTMDTLRGFYKTAYNVPDDIELIMMEASPIPERRDQAMKLRARMADLPTFPEALDQWRKQGYVPGTGPAAQPVEPSVQPGAPTSAITKEQAVQYLKQAGWNGVGQPTEEQKRKARELANSQDQSGTRFKINQ